MISGQDALAALSGGGHGVGLSLAWDVQISSLRIIGLNARLRKTWLNLKEQDLLFMAPCPAGGVDPTSYKLSCRK
jgi:hypothetical protein